MVVAYTNSAVNEWQALTSIFSPDHTGLLDELLGDGEAIAVVGHRLQRVDAVGTFLQRDVGVCGSPWRRSPRSLATKSVSQLVHYEHAALVVRGGEADDRPSLTSRCGALAATFWPFLRRMSMAASKSPLACSGLLAIHHAGASASGAALFHVSGGNCHGAHSGWTVDADRNGHPIMQWSHPVPSSTP